MTTEILALLQCRRPVLDRETSSYRAGSNFGGILYLHCCLAQQDSKGVLRACQKGQIGLDVYERNSHSC